MYSTFFTWFFSNISRFNPQASNFSTFGEPCDGAALRMGNAGNAIFCGLQVSMIFFPIPRANLGERESYWAHWLQTSSARLRQGLFGENVKRCCLSNFKTKNPDQICFLVNLVLKRADASYVLHLLFRLQIGNQDDLKINFQL